MLAIDEMLLLMNTGHHLLVLLHEPLTDGDARIIVVGPHEDQNGIHAVAMLSLQHVRLTGDIVPLPPTDSIHVWLHLQPVLEESPVFLLRPVITRISDGIAKVGNSLSLPRMLKQLLRHHRNNKHKY